MEKKYYIVRTREAGVFYGEIKERSSEEITMKNVRKLWYWEGACAVEQIAVAGVAKPEKCKFTVVVDEMIIANPIQIIPCSEKSKKSIDGVKIWKI